MKGQVDGCGLVGTFGKGDRSSAERELILRVTVTISLVEGSVRVITSQTDLYKSSYCSFSTRSTSYGFNRITPSYTLPVTIPRLRPGIGRAFSSPVVFTY